MEKINEIYNQLDQKFLDYLASNNGQMPSIIYMNYKIALDLVKQNYSENNPMKPTLGNLHYKEIPICTVLDASYTFDYFDEVFVQLARSYKRWKMPRQIFTNFEIDPETGEYPEVEIEIVEIPIAVLVPKYNPDKT